MTSGILVDESIEADCAAVAKVAEAVAIAWNEKSSDALDFTLTYQRRKIESICELARNFSAHGVFPSPPGPFKRVALLLVLGRLYPFFTLVPYASDEDAGLESPLKRDAWNCRMMLLTVPAALHGITITLDEAEIELPPFEGFPSPHYKLDLLTWLKWMDHGGKLSKIVSDKEAWEKFTGQRLVRMVLTTSLILEACYYLSTTEVKLGFEHAVQGKADACLKAALDADETGEIKLDLNFDRYFLNPDG